MVDVLFLGTGDAFSAGTRGNLALVIEAPGFRTLVEAGPLVVERLAQAGLALDQIEHLFVSHAHGDHCLGFPMLALGRLRSPHPLHVYAASSTCDALEALCAISYAGFGLQHRNLVFHRLSDERADRCAPADGVMLRTAVVRHPPAVPTLAARWDFETGISVTFVTDTVPNHTSVRLARDSTLLIHEATYSTRLEPALDPAPQYHSTARQAGELARAAGCQALALVHLGVQGSAQPEVLIEEARDGSDLRVVVPRDGERLTLEGS